MTRYFPEVLKQRNGYENSHPLIGGILEVRDSSFLFTGTLNKEDLYSRRYMVTEIKASDTKRITFSRNKSLGKILGSLVGGVIGLTAGIVQLNQWDPDNELSAFFTVLPFMGITLGCAGTGLAIGAILDGALKVSVPIQGSQEKFVEYKDKMKKFSLQCKSGGNLSLPCSVQILEDSLVDVDGNVYQMVAAGGHIWMYENLRVIRYSNGDTIPDVTSREDWEKCMTGASCNVMNKPGYAATYGRLYNRFAVNDHRNLCPSGWHVSSYEEWSSLISCFGGETYAGEWFNGKIHGPSFSFPSGSRDKKGVFTPPQHDSQFWWKKNGENEFLIGFSVKYKKSEITYLNRSVGENSGMSVRCVKDN